ncbi:MAG: DUF4197 domain-containing protein [Verrucomicrobiia bacterium]
MKTLIRCGALMMVIAIAYPADPPAATPDNPAPSRSLWGTLGRIFKGTNPTNSAERVVSVSHLSQDQIARALREALGQGLDQAVAQLGKEGGFLSNPNVRIPVPERLQTVEKVLRRAGQDKLADDFVASMNHAAERAVPAAASVFSDAVKKMTMQDARAILTGPDNAATEYFRKTSGARLQEKFRPIVAEATAQAGVTSAYKNMADRAGFASSLFKAYSPDLDSYVTEKAADGLFKVVAEEEKKIRENPAERTTDLLRTVFGAIRK